MSRRGNSGRPSRGPIRPGRRPNRFSGEMPPDMRHQFDRRRPGRRTGISQNFSFRRPHDGPMGRHPRLGRPYPGRPQFRGNPRRMPIGNRRGIHHSPSMFPEQNRYGPYPSRGRGRRGMPPNFTSSRKPYSNDRPSGRHMRHRSESRNEGKRPFRSDHSDNLTPESNKTSKLNISNDTKSGNKATPDIIGNKTSSINRTEDHLKKFPNDLSKKSTDPTKKSR